GVARDREEARLPRPRLIAAVAAIQRALRRIPERHPCPPAEQALADQLPEAKHEGASVDGAYGGDGGEDAADGLESSELPCGERVTKLLSGLAAVVGVDRAGDLGDGEVALPVVVATFGGVIVLIPRIDVIVLDALDVAP